MKTWFKEGAGQPPGQPLFACVHVPEFAAQALLRLRPGLRGERVAVLEGAPPHERVCAANPLARRDGLLNGMTRVEAESIGGVMLLNRSEREEEAARAALLACAGSFTPRVESLHTNDAAVCVLDAAGLARLHRDAQTFAEALRRAFQCRGLHGSIAVSANFHAACALARGRPGITIAAPGEERKMLAPLLLEVLGLSAEQARTLGLWGIRTLGGVAALPQKELTARLGHAGKRLRELARGEHKHLFTPVPPLPLPEPSRLDATPARLAALVGEDRVGSPVPQNRNAPDSFSRERFTLERCQGAVATQKRAPAMRRLRPPEPVHVHTEDGQPVRFWFRGELFRVRSASGPWQLNGAWRSGTAWPHEYWDHEYWDVDAERSRPEPLARVVPAQPELYPFLLHAPAEEAPPRVCCRLRRNLGPDISQYAWCVESLYD